MGNDEMIICKNCRHFVGDVSPADPQGIHAEYGICKRYPPVFYKTKTILRRLKQAGETSGPDLWQQPEVTADQTWCGEFSLK